MVPAMGARLTCTSKMERKMLTWVCGWPSTVVSSTASTLPSAGATMAPGSAGTARSGSRKKNSTNPARPSSGAAGIHHPCQPSTPPASAGTAAKKKPVRTIASGRKPLLGSLHRFGLLPAIVANHLLHPVFGLELELLQARDFGLVVGGQPPLVRQRLQLGAVAGMVVRP